MKKSILNIGKILTKKEQKSIAGGGKFLCVINSGDRRCCTPSECGNTGGVWKPGHWGYGTSENCICF